MAALFPRWTNTFARVTGALLLATPAVAVAGLMLYQRTPFVTGQFTPMEQPIDFDHRHHVGDEAIDCRYCHQTVETAASAGMPSTATCMNCHAQVWNKSPRLEPLRTAYFTNAPIRWNRVHSLPQFVYFNHSIHVSKGVGCVTCHGRIDRMAHVEQVSPLTMAWCLDCHREPEPNLRPPDQAVSMTWQRPADFKPATEVHTRTSCTTCHR